MRERCAVDFLPQTTWPLAHVLHVEVRLVPERHSCFVAACKSHLPHVFVVVMRLHPIWSIVIAQELFNVARHIEQLLFEDGSAHVGIALPWS